MNPQEEAVAKLIHRAMTDLRRIVNLLEIIAWQGVMTVLLLTGILLACLP